MVWCEEDKLKRGWVGKGRGLREGTWFLRRGGAWDRVVREGARPNGGNVIL